MFTAKRKPRLAARKDWKGASIVKSHALAHDRPTAAVNNMRIILELESGADPIRGSIEHNDGTRHCFWGWLELIEELRRAAADEPRRPSQPYTVTGTSPSNFAAPAARPDNPHTKEHL